VRESKREREEKIETTSICKCKCALQAHDCLVDFSSGSRKATLRSRLGKLGFRMGNCSRKTNFKS